jgi:subtilisin family serine protease
MKLRCGKGDWLDLEHMPLEARRTQGLKQFEPKQRKASRAAFLANVVVERTFGKSGRTRAERVAAGANKVDVATFRDATGKLRVVYREAVVRFEPGVSNRKRKAVLDKFKLQIRARNKFDDTHVTVVDPRRYYVAEGMIELANALTETEEIAFAFPNFVSEFKRTAPAAGTLASWYLDRIGARRAWRRSRGQGIVIAVLDDGVDVEHPNLRRNIVRRPDPDEPRDICGRDFFIDERDRAGLAEHFDPRPKIFQYPFDELDLNDIHGTCCAGVAAARGEVGRVSGAAPRARILPVKIFHGDGLASEARIADAIRYASKHADILSCSWEAPRSPDIEHAMKTAGEGRGGLGCPLFFAAGNESAPVCYPARSRHAIAVGASTHLDRKASYSNSGRQLSIVAPSGVTIVNPFRKARPGMILTTDVSYRGRGFNIGSVDAGGPNGLHYNKFTGTSSATPLAAGVAALVLSANPKLTREEVRGILEQTADKIGRKSSYKPNGHSVLYGHGRINAARAVAQALQIKRRRKKT